MFLLYRTQFSLPRVLMMLVKQPNPINISNHPPSLTAHEIIVFFCCSLANIAYSKKEFTKVYSLKTNVSLIFSFVCNDSLILKLFYFLFWLVKTWLHSKRLQSWTGVYMCSGNHIRNKKHTKITKTFVEMSMWSIVYSSWIFHCFFFLKLNWWL